MHCNHTIPPPPHTHPKHTQCDQHYFRFFLTTTHIHGADGGCACVGGCPAGGRGGRGPIMTDGCGDDIIMLGSSGGGGAYSCAPTYAGAHMAGM